MTAVIAPIVEGHGEQESIRLLLTRIAEQFDLDYPQVIRPIRRRRSSLLSEKNDELGRAVQLAALKLQERCEELSSGLILILIDADEDPPCILGPKLLARARKTRGDADVACVVATVEYETWFVGAAESLRALLELQPEEPPEDPEGKRAGKGWITKRFRGPKYSETADQPSMTARMDLTLCRRRCPSFDKLCRELEARLSRRDAG